MSQKSRDVLRVVAGVYLAYLGVKSMMTVLSDRPENMTLFLIMAVLFIVTGAGYAIYTIKSIWASGKEEQRTIEENADSAYSDEESAEDKEEDDSEEEETHV